MAGRFFNDSDDTVSGLRRVIVNQAWVKRNLPGEDPIGERIKFTYSATQPFGEIVAWSGILQKPAWTAQRTDLFAPYLQDMSSFITYVVRTAGEPAGVIGALRSAMRDIIRN